MKTNQEKKRRERRHRAKKTKTIQNKTSILCLAGGPRTAQETQRKAETKGQKKNNNKKNIQEKVTKKEHKRDAADAESAYGGVPLTWQGTG